jgi:hypothetical protein
MARAGLRYVRTFYLEFDDPIPGTELGEVEYAITRDVWQADPSAPRGDDTAVLPDISAHTAAGQPGR